MPKRKTPQRAKGKYCTLPPPLDLTKTVTSTATSIAQVEQGDATDWNQGADPYLRVTGWKRP